MGITQDDTDSVLRAVDEKVATGLNEIAPEIVNIAKSIVVVKTGNLRDSIIAEVSDKEVVVGSPLDYAAVIEANKPYLRPALEAVKSKIRRVFGK